MIYFLAGFVITVWGITFICTRYLLLSFSPLEILMIRFLLGWITLWILTRRRIQLKEKKHELYFMLAGLFGVAMYQMMENCALNFTSPNNVCIIVSTNPMFTAIVTSIFLKEKNISPRFIIGFIVAMIGITLVTLNGTYELHLSPKGDFLALGSAISWAFYSMFVAKINKAKYETLIATRHVFFWALIFMIPMAISSFIIPSPLTSICTSKELIIKHFLNWKNWMNLLMLGCCASAFCFAAWSKACASIGTVKTTIGLYLMPVITIVFSYIFLHETISLTGLLGALLTICGLFIGRSSSSKKQ